MLTIIIFTGAAHAQWNNAATEPLSIGPDNDQLSKSALAIDGMGNLHAIMMRQPAAGDNDFYYFTKPSNGAWSAPVPFGNHAKQLLSPYLSVHKPSGTPYVAYLEDGALKLAVCASGVWTYHDLSTAGVTKLYSPSIDVDSLGYAHIAVINETGSTYKMSYGYWDKAQFHFQTITNSELGGFGSGASPSICALSTGSVAISYRGGNYPGYRIDVAENTALGGASWRIETMVNPGYDCYSPSIKATANNDLYLAYHGNMGWGMPNSVFYTTKPSGSPSFAAGSVVSGKLYGGGAKLSVEENGHAHIIFEEISGNFYTEVICYASNSTGAWNCEVLLKASKLYPSFVMDSSGNGSLVYSEYAGYMNYDIYYYGYASPQLFKCDVTKISEATGGYANFSLSAGAANMNRSYIIMGSVTGTSPGIPLPSGGAVLPLNWDIFTDYVILLANSPVFLNFINTLDGSGESAAKMDIGPIPGAAGLTMQFAYALAGPLNFASNPVGIEITP